MLVCCRTTYYFYILFTSSCNQKGCVTCFSFKQVVYNFLCHCDSRCVGCISQQLQNRIRQQVREFIKTGPILNVRNISTRSGKSSTPVVFSESAIGQHLLDNPMYAKNYRDKKFIILSFSRSSFHLSALEAVYIKSCKPNLCRQNKFVYNLKLLR